MEPKKAASTSDKQIRKGRLAPKSQFVVTSTGLFPIDVLRKYQLDRTHSQQLSRQESEFLEKKGLVPHPFNAKTLLEFQENNAYFDACVKQIAKDVAAPGWRLVPIDEKQEDKVQLERAEAFFDDPNDRDESMSRIIEKIISDWGAIGWTAMEHSRAADGMTDGIWHIPAQTVYAHQDHVLFAQVRGTKKRWFKRFGTPDNISSLTGDAVKSDKNKANEIIWYSNYYALSEYYGATNALPAIGAIMGMLGVRTYNLAFFENYGVPAGLVTLEGEWEEDAADQIRDFIDAEIRGSDNAHKTIVLELPEGGKATWSPLSVEIKEGSFTLWNDTLRGEILVCFRMPPYRIAIAAVGSLGGNVADEMTKIYNQSIIGPLKGDIGDMITRTVLRQGLEVDKYRFELIPLDIRDLDKLSILWDRLFKLGVINADWIRAKMGEEEREDGLGGEYYIAAGLLPVTGETIEKREHALNAWMEDESLRIAEKIKTLEAAQAAIREQAERENG